MLLFPIDKHQHKPLLFFTERSVVNAHTSKWIGSSCLNPPFGQFLTPVWYVGKSYPRYLIEILVFTARFTAFCGTPKKLSASSSGSTRFDCQWALASVPQKDTYYVSYILLYKYKSLYVCMYVCMYVCKYVCK